MAVKIIVGNALDVLPKLEANSVHCSISSPPYYGLRKYSGSQQCEWPEIEYSPMPGLPLIQLPGCNSGCEHEWGHNLPPVSGGGQTDFSTSTLKQDGRPEKSRQRTLLQRAKELKRKAPSGAGAYCQKCGGWRGALGNEPTLEMYIGHLVAIYREVYRVLREDGVAWVVMGDSFASTAQGTKNAPQPKGSRDQPGQWANFRPKVDLEGGNLMMVPHRFALALQADGWIVRNDCVFSKKSPMPESVSGWRWQRHRIKIGDEKNAGLRAGRAAHGDRNDGGEQSAPIYIDCPGCPKCEANDGYVLKRGSWRHTRSHEFVFMLTKKMGYHANQEKVREALKRPEEAFRKTPAKFGGALKHKGFQTRKHSGNEYKPDPATGRNPRSVLTPKPEPYPGKHFAVYPTSLIEPLVKATCPDKCCPECGMGWNPVVERSRSFESGSGKAGNRPEGKDQEGHGLIGNDLRMGPTVQSNVLGYRPTCTCEPAIDDPGVMMPFEPSGNEGNWQPTPVPGIVLDPFLGSGTTALVTERLGLNCIGIEISQEYAEMAQDRITGDAPLLNKVEIINLYAETDPI